MEGIFSEKVFTVDMIYIPDFVVRSEFNTINNVKEEQDFFGCRNKLNKYLGTIINMENQKDRQQAQL